MDEPLPADAEFQTVCNFALQFQKNPVTLRQKSTVIKYTKIPDYDFDAQASWPTPDSYVLHPRLRRIITLDDQVLNTSRSLKPSALLDSPCRKMSSITQRKIVTITEDEESDLHPKFSKDAKSTPSTNRAVGQDKPEVSSSRNPSRWNSSHINTKEYKSSAKQNMKLRREPIVSTAKRSEGKVPSSTESLKNRNVNERGSVKSTRSSNTPAKISVSKTFTKSSESEQEINLIKEQMMDNLKSYTSNKKYFDRTTYNRSQLVRTKVMSLKDLKTKSKPVPVIRVPLDVSYQVTDESEEVDVTKRTEAQNGVIVINSTKVNEDRGTEMELCFKDVDVGTDPAATTTDQMTDMDDFEPHLPKTGQLFDSLQVPNVSLTKQTSAPKDIDIVLASLSLPSLQAPPFTIPSPRDEVNKTTVLKKNNSYIIGRATLTYTTKQKIDFHVVGNEPLPNLCPSPLSTYPLSVVSVYKNKLHSRESKEALANGKEIKTNGDNFKALNCSYSFNSDKLVKPSDVISTIRFNSGLLKGDFVSEQFQRELNFIDSFFESLKYLESSSFTDRSLSLNKAENWITKAGLELENSEYNKILRKLENGASVDDTHAMASKSLCLLNLLIRDEQRRAKNLLFVLKMREDALKDFTKSQILYLENKKKQDNTDISTLKKKQRGALLKLQHECGEMQRMRKALVALSERRKSALIKTKKNIELKLTSKVDVENILSGKKKLRRTSLVDRVNAPLKCFDLSTSGEDSMTPHAKSESVIVITNIVTSAEKSIQTGDSLLGTLLVDQSTDTAAENFVVVDGGYLNILFQNLHLPRIFSGGKQYEVNEEALQNIINSSNSNKTFNDSDLLEKFMEDFKTLDASIQNESTTPSTARSLVEEFDQYYKGLAEEDKEYASDHPEIDSSYEKEVSTQDLVDKSDKETVLSRPNMDFSCMCDINSVETQAGSGSDLVLVPCQAGPLPVPAGESSDESKPEAPAWSAKSTSSSSSSSDDVSSTTSGIKLVDAPPSSPAPVAFISNVDCEAERLRRKQLAIEREIKALEQQQCQHLVVREIPDKPPPPYTPPAEARSSARPPPKFRVDDLTEQKIQKHFVEAVTAKEWVEDSSDHFQAFVTDYCAEALQRHKVERSEDPWDACNLLPKKPEVDIMTLAKTTSAELKEVLTGVPATVVTGLGTRRSDHIDDILFAEWRRCEPEWTTLHVDEAIVKNQVFESIFQKVLSETVDAYKQTVLGVGSSV